MSQTCPHCSAEFTPNKGTKAPKFCGQACSNRARARPPMTEKACCRCGDVKPIGEFPVLRTKIWTGPSAWCRLCHRQYGRAFVVGAISDAYVANQLRCPVADLQPDVAAAYRERLLEKRKRRGVAA